MVKNKTWLVAIREYTENHNENVYNVYALDVNERLMGVASIRDLLLSPTNQPLAAILRTNIISAQ